MTFSSLLNKKFLSRGFTVFLFFLVLNFNFPKHTTAQWTVIDPANLIQNTISATADTAIAFGTQPIIASSEVVKTGKEFFGDGIGYIIAKSILRGITAQTVNWINSGFKGSPAFITDPERFFRDQADLQLERILGDQLNGLCKPFELKVRLAIVTTYLQQARPPVCTFDKIKRNFENFGDDLTKGGWKDWFDYTQIDANNPYGAYYQSKDFINIQISSNQQRKREELSWGKGFLSFKKCVERGGTRDVSIYGEYDEEGNYIPPTDTSDQQDEESYGNQDANTLTLQDDPETCSRSEIVTPGSVINDQLSKVLGSGINQLELADEINEIADALMNQLFKRAIGASINGLKGLSKKDTNERRPFLEELLSRETDSLSSQQDNQNLQRIDNSIPPGMDEILRPVTTEDGQVTTDVTDISNIRPGQYINPNDIESIVDDEIARANQKYNLSVGSQNNSNTTCNSNGTLNDGSGTPCTP